MTDSSANGTNEANIKLTELQWRDRSWSEVEFDFPMKAGDLLDEAVRRNGWHRVQTIGDRDSLSIDVFARSSDSVPQPKEPRYFVCYNTSDSWEIIVIPRLQDLIDFLAHVSTTMLAALLPDDASMILHDLCERAPWRVEERKREREREREQTRERSATRSARAPKETE